MTTTTKKKRKSTKKRHSKPAVTAAATVTVPGVGNLPKLPADLSKLSASALKLLVGSFPVPPFLLPIYQAAGIEYGVPWQVLAAINEIETDFGRDLNTSSAGAVGWMQFLPSSWARFGVNADGGSSANPDDPVDAIFAAARYLRAAGAESDVAKAIFAYNHANWYVNDVELRARLLQALPTTLVDGLTGLMQASFPVAGHLGAAATAVPKLVRIDGRVGALITAPAGAAVIAPADGTIVALGDSPALGLYVTLEDSYGDRFTLAGLGRVESEIAVLTPRVESAQRVARQLGLSARFRRSLPPATRETVIGLGSSPAVSGASNAASQGTSGAVATEASANQAIAQPLVKERLFADPSRPGSYAAGGNLQLHSSLSSYAAAFDLKIGRRRSDDVFSRALTLKTGRFTLAPLRVGAVVAAGTVLGRVGTMSHGSSGVVIQIRPAGARTDVDPRSILSGWKLLGRLTNGKADLGGTGAAAAYGARNGTIGQLLLSDRAELGQAVLSDPRVKVDACDRAAIAAGRVDRRALAIIEYLSYSGLGPDVSGLACGRGAGSAPQIDISSFDGVAVAGHQQAGGIVDLAIRQLLALSGTLRPARVISLLSYPWEATALSLPDHAASVEVDLSPRPAGAGSLGRSLWGRLIRRLNQVSVALTVGGARRAHA